VASRSGARQVAMIEARMSFGEQACSCQRESDGVGHDERRTLLLAANCLVSLGFSAVLPLGG
jgi:hypothetical protein